jgi:hypothetical protein
MTVVKILYCSVNLCFTSGSPVPCSVSQIFQRALMWTFFIKLSFLSWFHAPQLSVSCFRRSTFADDDLNFRGCILSFVASLSIKMSYFVNTYVEHLQMMRQNPDTLLRAPNLSNLDLAQEGTPKEEQCSERSVFKCTHLKMSSYTKRE